MGNFVITFLLLLLFRGNVTVEYTESLIDCLSQIIHEHIGNYKSLTIAYPTELGNDLIRRVQSNYKQSLQILTKSEETLSGTDGYVIEFCHPSELAEFLSHVSNNLKRTQKFIILPTCEIQKRQIIKPMWSVYLSNFIVIMENDIFAWFPFDENNCGNTSRNLIKINRCSEGQLLINKTLFPKKIPNKMNNCPITVHLPIIPPAIMNKEEGSIIDLIKLLSKDIKFTPVFVFEKRENFTEFPSKQFILTPGKSELAFSPDVLTPFKYNKYDFSDWYFMDADVLCVKRPREQPNWIKLGKLVLMQTYLIFPLTFYILITYIIARILNTKEKYNSAINIFFYYFRAISNMTNITLPKHTVLRILFAAWLLFCLIITINYNTVLYGLLHNPTYVKQDIKRISKEYKLMIPLYYDVSEIDVNDIKSLKPCEDILSCIEEIISGEDSLIVFKETIYLYNKYRYIDDNGNAKLRCYPMNTDMNYMRIILNKNFFLTRELTRVIQQVKSGGLYRKFVGDNLFKEQIFRYKLWSEGEREIHRRGILKFKDFIVMYIYLFLGITLSTIAFISEIVYFRMKQKTEENKNKQMVLQKFSN